MCFPLHSAYHADFYFRLRAILLGWSWTALLTKPVMMLACFLRHRNSRLGSAFVMHLNEKRLRTTQENITQLARRMEVEMSLTQSSGLHKGRHLPADARI
jgi:hypothetical protein